MGRLSVFLLGNKLNFLLYIQGSFQSSGFDLDDMTDFSADCHARNINTGILAESQESQQEAICSSLTFSPSLSLVSLELNSKYSKVYSYAFFF